MEIPLWEGKVSMSYLNVKQRLILVTTITVFITTTAISLLSQRLFSQLLYERFEEKMNFIGQHLAASTAIGIVLKNERLLGSVASSILKDSDVIGVAIEDNQHKMLYKKGNVNGKHFLIFPVFFSPAQESFIFNLKSRQKNIGWIKIFYTTHHLNQLIKNLFLRSSILALIISIFMGIFVYFLIAQSFLRPLQELLMAVDKVTQGDLSCKVSGKGLPETEQLAEAFTQMVASLKHSQHLLKKTYEEMVYQKSLAEIGKISFIVAHEVKNPLGIIKGGVDILKKPEVDQETKKQMILYIEEEIKRLDRFIKDFLSLARPKRPELKEIDLSQFMQNLKQKVKMGFPEKKISIVFQENLPRFISDPVLIERVLVNLIKNAYEAGANEVKIEIAQTEDKWIIKVIDNGPGIPEEEKEKIFEPFYTTKAKGTGLGLVFVSQAVYALGGKIELKNHIPSGNIFIIYLPIHSKNPTKEKNNGLHSDCR